MGAAHYLGAAGQWQPGVCGGGPGSDSGVHVADKGSDLDKQLGECWAGGHLGSLF